MKTETPIVKIILITVFVLASMPISRGQFTDCSTGLLQMPTAEMQEDGTFMVTNNFLNKHSLSTKWGYNTFQYGVYVSFWGRMEIGYVCTIFNGAWDPNPNKPYRHEIIRNQDRHFVGRICLLREGEFGKGWIPALVVGTSDPTTGTDGDYSDLDGVAGDGNGYFNRYYIALTKHFQTGWGTVGAHVGYQFNQRTDYPINGPCAGVNWQPIWLTSRGILDSLNVIAEFDARTMNVGMIASIWNNHFEFMFELQNFRWVNFGLRYKFKIK